MAQKILQPGLHGLRLGLSSAGRQYKPPTARGRLPSRRRRTPGNTVISVLVTPYTISVDVNGLPIRSRKPTLTAPTLGNRKISFRQKQRPVTIASQ